MNIVVRPNARGFFPNGVLSRIYAIMREAVIAVKKLASTPKPRVTANPFTAPTAKLNNTNAAKKVVTLESKIAENARSKPLRIAETGLLVFLNSSLARSKTSTLPSTAIPMDNTKPAIPGKVSTAPKPIMAPVTMMA